MVRPLARQAWQSDADRIDSLERWRITAPLQADHLAELAELRAKTEAPIHGVGAPDVDEDFKTEPIANRTDDTIMTLTTDTLNRHRTICEVEGFAPTVRRWFNPTPGVLDLEVAATFDDWTIHSNRNGISVLCADLSDEVTPTQAANKAKEMLAIATMAVELEGLNSVEAAQDVLSQLGTIRPVQHPELGRALAGMRQTLGVTLEDVEREELIPAAMLEQIEAGTIGVETGEHGEIIDAVVATWRIMQAEAQQLRRPVDACAAPEFDGIV